MKYAHLLHTFYGLPWYLRPDYYRNFHVIIQRALAGQEVSGRVVEPQSLKRIQRTAVHSMAPSTRAIVGPIDADSGQPIIPQMETIGPVAIIPVYGVLGKKLCLLDLLCGGSDYSHISAFIEMAATDPAITSVVFDFDTPGGMSSGCMECAQDIAALQARKPTYGFTESQCCSAGYWLASQCGEFYGTPTSVVGNVGTILCGVDNSMQWEKEGMKLELFVSSPLKATGVDGKPWTDADRAYLGERMQQADARIKSSVRAGRPQIDPTALDGRWFFAENCVDLSVVNGVTHDLNEVIASVLALTA